MTFVEFEDGTGPAMRDEQRHRTRVTGFIWANWISMPSIRVMNCGKAFSFLSAARQSSSAPQ